MELPTAFDQGATRALEKASRLMNEPAVRDLCEAVGGTIENLLTNVERAAKAKDIGEVDRLAEELKFLAQFTERGCPTQARRLMIPHMRVRVEER